MVMEKSPSFALPSRQATRGRKIMIKWGAGAFAGNSEHNITWGDWGFPTLYGGFPRVVLHIIAPRC